MCRLRALAVSLVLSFTAFSPSTQADVRNKVIYGEDNRMDLFDPSAKDKMVELAQSTAVLVRNASLTETESGFRLPGTTFGESMNLCRNERFREQPAPGFCSGFLVEKNVVVTAGHCIRSSSECERTAFVFGFGYHSEGIDPTQLDPSQVYRCKSIIAQELNSTTGSDFAVLYLDREVENIEPVQLREEGSVNNGDMVTVIGHPSGIPTKITSSGRVRDTSPATYFVGSFDTYGGNSGSAVFNSATGLVEGILVRGEQDFETRGSCLVSKKCSEGGCRGEDVTKISEVLPFLPSWEPLPPDGDRFTYDLVSIEAEIPDNDNRGVLVPINVDAAGSLTGLSLEIKVQHPYIGDLVISLIHPDGSEVVLRDRMGGGESNIDITYGWGGVVVNELNNLIGKPSSGQWKIKVSDLSVTDFGWVTDVKLTIFSE